MHAQVKRLEVKVEREQKILAVMSELSLQIIELVRQQGRATISEVLTHKGKNRNTIKWHLQKLVLAGHLSQHGASTAVRYALL